MSKLSERRETENVEVQRRKAIDAGALNLRVELVLLFASITLGAASNWVFNKAEFAMFCWIGFCILLGDLICHVKPIRYWTTKRRAMVTLGLAVVISVPGILFLNSQRRAQHAALTSGLLIATHDGPDTDAIKANLGLSFVKPFWSKFGFFVGEDLRWDLGSGHIASKIKVVKRDGKPLLSATVRDPQGNLIVEIKDNRWQIAPNNVWDKNYTKDTLEVKDARGRIVLQVRLLRNEVLLDGEWPTASGAGTVFAERSRYSKEDGFKPLFKYPSSENWGSYVDGEGPYRGESPNQ